MRPGLAFFLEKQLRDQLEVATREALVTLAQKTYERLLGHAVAGQVNPVGTAGEQTRDVEILRASFLVTRERTDHFMEEVRSNTDAADGLRCEWSGPWPPYSFAAGNNEDA